MSSSDEATNRIGAVSPDRASSTFLPDWVFMNPAPDHAKVFYWAVRSFVFEKDAEHTADVTDDEMAELLIRSRDSVRRSRLAAEKHQLLQCVGEQKRTAVTNGKRHSLPVVRSLLVHIDPPPGYEGPVNPYTERRNIRARQNGRADVRNRPDQGNPDSSTGDTEEQHAPDQEENKKSPGQDGCSDLQYGGADVQYDDADVQYDDADVHPSTGPDQGKPGPQVAFSSCLLKLPPQDTPVGDAHASEPEPDSNEGGEEAPQDNPERHELAVQFCKSLPTQPGAEPPSTPEKHEMISLVLQAWDYEIGNAELRDELTSSLATVKHLGSTWVHRLKRLVARAADRDRDRGVVLPSCRTCNVQEGEPDQWRTVLVDGSDPKSATRPCPDCRPGTDASVTAIHEARSA